PPVNRHGMPGFPRVLEAISRAYHEQPQEVAKAVGQLLAGVQRSEESVATEAALDPPLPRRAAGGLGSAPKFPHPRALQLLLRQWRVTGRQELFDAVTLTAQRMAEGGIYDQIGGGFHRYSVDARWLVPHFEKMLYDNAELPRLYLELYQVTGDVRHR